METVCKMSMVQTKQKDQTVKPKHEKKKGEISYLKGRRRGPNFYNLRLIIPH